MSMGHATLPLMRLSLMLLMVFAVAAPARAGVSCDAAGSGSESYRVAFKTGSTALDPRGKETVRRAAERARLMIGVCVIGRASKAGGDARNMKLAKARADGVAKALAGFGVKPGVIQAQARGEAYGGWFSGIVNNADDDRVVEIYFPEMTAR